MRITVFQVKKINEILEAAEITYKQLHDPDMIKRSYKTSCLNKTLTPDEYSRVIARSMPYFQGKVDGIKKIIAELKMTIV